MGSSGQSTLLQVQTLFAGAAAVIVESASILTEFSDPPVDPGNIQRRLRILETDSAVIARRIQDLLDADQADTSRHSELSRLSYMLDLVIDHLGVVADIARMHDLIAVPDELVDLITILLGCAQLTAVYIAALRGRHRELHCATMRYRAEDGLRIGEEFLLHRPARAYTRSALLEICGALNRAAHSFHQVADALHTMDTLA